MHFLIIIVHPDSQVLLSASKQMEDALEGYATLYAYDNLSSDPYPGKHQCIPYLHSHRIVVLNITYILMSYQQSHNYTKMVIALLLIVLSAISCPVTHIAQWNRAMAQLVW